jgi:hypothetical protein
MSIVMKLAADHFYRDAQASSAWLGVSAPVSAHHATPSTEGCLIYNHRGGISELLQSQ